MHWWWKTHSNPHSLKLLANTAYLLSHYMPKFCNNHPHRQATPIVHRVVYMAVKQVVLLEREGNLAGIFWDYENPIMNIMSRFAIIRAWEIKTYSTFPSSQKQCKSQPEMLLGISDQLSKTRPLYSHEPLLTPVSDIGYLQNIYKSIEKCRWVVPSLKSNFIFCLHFILSGQHLGAIARKVAGSGAHLTPVIGENLKRFNGLRTS